MNYLFYLLFVYVFSVVSSNNDNYTKIFIPKGIPFSFPRETKFFITNVKGSAYFTDETKYNCNNSHQYDWNKLTGISFTPWKPDTDALMIAWRYLIEPNEFQIGPYYNVKSSRILPQLNETIIIKENDPFYFFIDYNGIHISYHDDVIDKPKPHDLITNYYLSTRISTWFGGSSLPPNDIFLFLNF